MKTNALKFVASALLLSTLVLPAAAFADPGSVNQRLDNQHNRIVQGNRTSELTYGEDRRLATDESRIRFQEDRDRYFDNGHLNGFQRHQLDNELNRSSRSIYHLKHNDQVR